MRDFIRMCRGVEEGRPKWYKSEDNFYLHKLSFSYVQIIDMKALWLGQKMNLLVLHADRGKKRWNKREIEEEWGHTQLMGMSFNLRGAMRDWWRNGIYLGFSDAPEFHLCKMIFKDSTEKCVNIQLVRNRYILLYLH